MRKKFLEVRDDDPYVCLSCISDPVLRGATALARHRRTCVVCDCQNTDAVSVLVLTRTAAGVIRRVYEEFDDTLYDDRNGLKLLDVLKRVLAVDDTAFCEQVAVHLRDQCQKSDRAFFAVGVRYGRRLAGNVGGWNQQRNSVACTARS
jgi:hypothetical protein